MGQELGDRSGARCWFREGGMSPFPNSLLGGKGMRTWYMVSGVSLTTKRLRLKVVMENLKRNLVSGLGCATN